MANHGPDRLQCNVADQLATVLNGKAVHDQNQWTCEIVLPDGLALLVHAGRGDPRAERAEVSLCMVSDAVPLWAFLPHGAAAPSMTFSVDRDAVRVAGEVIRKVIEPGRPLIAQALERKAQADAHEATRSAASKRLCEIVGGSLTDHNDIYIPQTDVLYGKITAHSAESFTIDVHVSSLAVAEQMLKAMMAAVVAQASTEEVTHDG